MATTGQNGNHLVTIWSTQDADQPVLFQRCADLGCGIWVPMAGQCDPQTPNGRFMALGIGCTKVTWDVFVIHRFCWELFIPYLLYTFHIHCYMWLGIFRVYTYAHGCITCVCKYNIYIYIYYLYILHVCIAAWSNHGLSPHDGRTRKTSLFSLRNWLDGSASQRLGGWAPGRSGFVVQDASGAETCGDCPGVISDLDSVGTEFEDWPWLTPQSHKTRGSHTGKMLHHCIITPQFLLLIIPFSVCIPSSLGILDLYCIG